MTPILQDAWWPVSPEFLNYGVALTVYAIRYAAVFWNTNKGLAFVFSLQLFANSMQVNSEVGIYCKSFTLRGVPSVVIFCKFFLTYSTGRWADTVAIVQPNW